MRLLWEGGLAKLRKITSGPNMQSLWLTHRKVKPKIGQQIVQTCLEDSHLQHFA